MRVPLLDLQAQYISLSTELDVALMRVAKSQACILGPEVSAELSVDLLIALFPGISFTRYTVYLTFAETPAFTGCKPDLENPMSKNEYKNRQCITKIVFFNFKFENE